MSRIETGWKVSCEVCQQNVEQGNPSDLVFLMLDDGSSQGLNACAKCAVLVRQHMDECAVEDIAADKLKGPKQFTTREDIEERGRPKVRNPIGRTAPPPEPEQPSANTLADALNAMSGAILELTKRVASLEDAPKKGRNKRSTT